MFDAKIVSACIADRSAYEQVAPHVNAAEFTPTGRFWWGLVADWYARDPRAGSIDPAMLRDRGERSAGRNSGLSLDWFDGRPDAPSPGNVAWEVLELKRTVKWRELAAAMEAEWERDKIIQLVREHQALMEATSLEQSALDEGASLEELSREIGDEHRIRLWPEKLQAVTGGALEGDVIVMFGRPEVGKSLAAVNMTCGWLRDGHRVLYIGNEDNINKIKGRIRNNLSGMSPDEVRQYTDEANRRALKKGWQNLKAIHLFPGSASEIAKHVEKFQPKAVVIDQLRNLQSGASKGGTKAQRLDDIACDVRQLAARHKVVALAIGQAHAPEHGKQKAWLSLDDFDESRTGVPGQADLMIGIGMDATLDAHNQRAWSVPKNKMSGNHEGFVVNIDKHRSKIQ